MTPRNRRKELLEEQFVSSLSILAAAGGEETPLWTVVPFALLLLSIAILPLAAPHWWHRNRNKGLLAAAFGLPVALYLFWKDPAALATRGWNTRRSSA